MNPKQELLDEAALQFRAFHDAIHGLNEEQMMDPWFGGWSIRDIIAHLAGWHAEMMPALERLARGQRPFPEGVVYDDVDAWNARFTAARRETEVTEVLLELDRSHERFLHAAAQVPDERYVPGKTAWKIVDLNSATHYREHGDAIRAWRARRGL
jgi:hypothetical protein